VINIKEDTSVFWTDKRKAEIIANNMCVTQEETEDSTTHTHTNFIYTFKKKRKRKSFIYII